MLIDDYQRKQSRDFQHSCADDLPVGDSSVREKGCFKFLLRPTIPPAAEVLRQRRAGLVRDGRLFRTIESVGTVPMIHSQSQPFS